MTHGRSLLSLSRAAASPTSPRGGIVYARSYTHALQWVFFVLPVAVVVDAAQENSLM